MENRCFAVFGCFVGAALGILINWSTAAASSPQTALGVPSIILLVAFFLLAIFSLVATLYFRNHAKEKRKNILATATRGPSPQEDGK
ncbi:MAG: hypothetical protein V3T83_04800 [Acidobacteriota bacterium]